MNAERKREIECGEGKYRRNRKNSRQTKTIGESANFTVGNLIISFRALGNLKTS